MFNFETIAAFVLGNACMFFLTRIANHLNGKAALQADLDWLKAEFAKLKAKLDPPSA